MGGRKGGRKGELATLNLYTMMNAFGSSVYTVEPLYCGHLGDIPKIGKFSLINNSSVKFSCCFIFVASAYRKCSFVLIIRC